MSNSSTSDRFYFSDETLSLINKYSGSTFVIKYGGSVMKNDSLKLNVIQDISFLYSLGIKIILVHGGGYLIDQWLNKLDIQPKFDNGLRVTDLQTMEVVEMVLCGKVNKDISSLLSKNKINSIGLSGKDSHLITASPLSTELNNFTGKIEKININMLNNLLNNNILPVIASVAVDMHDETYNVNADTLAGSIASFIKADKLILITDTPGLLLNISDKSSLLKCLNTNKAETLIRRGIITDGMIPKLDSCINAVNNSVEAAHIIDGRVRYALLHEVLTHRRIGSMLVK